MFHTYITASSGAKIDIDRASFVMDLELFQDALDAEGSAKQRVWDLYCRLHKERYGGPFTPDVDPEWDQPTVVYNPRVPS